MFEDRLATSIDRLKDDWSVHRTLTETALFGPLGLLAAGEEVGQLQDALEKTAECCEQALEHTLKAVTSALQPIMLLAIGLLVGFMLISTLSPLLTVVQSL